MKILKAGSKGCGGWWHGMMFTCPDCRQEVELQDGDQHLPNVEVATNSVSVKCSCCERMNTVSKPPTKAEALAIYDGYAKGFQEALSRPPQGR